jgi:hypothetical protein
MNARLTATISCVSGYLKIKGFRRVRDDGADPLKDKDAA